MCHLAIVKNEQEHEIADEYGRSDLLPSLSLSTCRVFLDDRFHPLLQVFPKVLPMIIDP